MSSDRHPAGGSLAPPQWWAARALLAEPQEFPGRSRPGPRKQKSTVAEDEAPHTQPGHGMQSPAGHWGQAALPHGQCWGPWSRCPRSPSSLLGPGILWLGPSSQRPLLGPGILWLGPLLPVVQQRVVPPAVFPRTMFPQSTAQEGWVTHTRDLPWRLSHVAHHKSAHAHTSHVHAPSRAHTGRGPEHPLFICWKLRRSAAQELCAPAPRLGKGWARPGPCHTGRAPPAELEGR